MNKPDWFLLANRFLFPIGAFLFIDRYNTVICFLEEENVHQKSMAK